MKDIPKINVVNNEKYYINKRFQLYRFARIGEWIPKCFHAAVWSLTWAFKKTNI